MANELKMQMHAACNTKIDVAQVGGEFRLQADCPAGHGNGELVAKHLDSCLGCPKRTAAGTNLTIEKKESNLEGAAGGVNTGDIGGGAETPALPPAPAALPPPLESVAAAAPPAPQQTMPSPLIPLPSVAPAAPVAPSVVALPQESPPAPQEFVPVDKAALPPDPELPPLETIALPGGLTIAAVDASDVDLDAILGNIPGLPFSGSSAGGFSSHKLKDAECWRRFYLAHILGMQPRKSKAALQRGTLYHAVMAMRYSGLADRQFEPLEHAAQAGLADMAFKVKAMCMMQFEKFRSQEWSTWCVRAVEHNMLAWLPLRVGKKTIGVPLSCRADMILGFKRPDEPHPPGGPLAQGVFLHDWKTSSGITYDLVEGYGMDFQFLTEAAIFTLGGHEQVFGPFRGVTVNIASTARKQPTFDDFVHIQSPIPNESLASFIEQELKPLAAECYERVTDAETRGDINQWPMDRRHCIGRWGRCQYFDYCDRGASVMYKIEEGRILTEESLAKPPKGWKASAPEEAAAPEKPKKSKKQPAELSPQTGLLAQSILKQVEEGQIPSLDKSNYCTPGHTYQSVVKDLTAALRATYEPLAEGKKTFGLEGLEWKFLKTGCSWKNGNGEKGRVSWKNVAEWICQKSWFDLSTALPQ